MRKSQPVSVAAPLKPRLGIEKVLPGDPDWEIVHARRREPLADFEAYHRKRQETP